MTGCWLITRFPHLFSSSWTTGQRLGGCDDTMAAHAEGRLLRLVKGDAATNGDVPAPAQVAENAIKSNNVVVFSKSFCPFCTKVKDLFNALHIQYEGRMNFSRKDMLSQGSFSSYERERCCRSRKYPNLHIAV